MASRKYPPAQPISTVPVRDRACVDCGCYGSPMNERGACPDEEACEERRKDRSTQQAEAFAGICGEMFEDGPGPIVRCALPAGHDDHRVIRSEAAPKASAEWGNGYELGYQRGRSDQIKPESQSHCAACHAGDHARCNIAVCSCVCPEPREGESAVPSSSPTADELRAMGWVVAELLQQVGPGHPDWLPDVLRDAYERGRLHERAAAPSSCEAEGLHEPCRECGWSAIEKRELVMLRKIAVAVRNHRDGAAFASHTFDAFNAWATQFTRADQEKKT